MGEALPDGLALGVAGLSLSPGPGWGEPAGSSALAAGPDWDADAAGVVGGEGSPLVDAVALAPDGRDAPPGSRPGDIAARSTGTMTTRTTAETMSPRRSVSRRTWSGAEGLAGRGVSCVGRSVIGSAQDGPYRDHASRQLRGAAPKITHLHQFDHVTFVPVGCPAHRCPASRRRPVRWADPLDLSRRPAAGSAPTGRPRSGPPANQSPSS